MPLCDEQTEGKGLNLTDPQPLGHQVIDQEQRLAITIAGLMLVSGVLIGQEVIGTWATFAAGSSVFVGAYTLPLIVRELTVRRFNRRLRRWPTSRREA